MATFNALILALSGFAWPALILAVGLYYRSNLNALLKLFQEQLASGAAVKWKDFEFRAIHIDADAKDGTGYIQTKASEVFFQRRHKSYKNNKNLFLVHRIKPTGALHPFNQLPTYDITVYLVSHKNFGHLNDVKEVHYYFGQHFGLKSGEYGTTYIVSNGTDSFAVRTNAYGPMLCEALIVFHDGTESHVSRYLDFEGTGYRFNAATNETDAAKIAARAEA
jgi:prokaryotic YEATS domain